MEKTQQDAASTAQGAIKAIKATDLHELRAIIKPAQPVITILALIDYILFGGAESDIDNASEKWPAYQKNILPKEYLKKL